MLTKRIFACLCHNDGPLARDGRSRTAREPAEFKQSGGEPHGEPHGERSGQMSGAFRPASLLGAAGTDVQSTLGAVQRMGLNLGTAVDTSVGSSFLSLSLVAATSLSAVGVRYAWTYGALTLVVALVLAIRAMAFE